MSIDILIHKTCYNYYNESCKVKNKWIKSKKNIALRFGRRVGNIGNKVNFFYGFICYNHRQNRDLHFVCSINLMKKSQYETCESRSCCLAKIYLYYWNIAVFWYFQSNFTVASILQWSIEVFFILFTSCQTVGFLWKYSYIYWFR